MRGLTVWCWTTQNEVDDTDLLRNMWDGIATVLQVFRRINNSLLLDEAPLGCRESLRSLEPKEGEPRQPNEAY